MIALWTLSNSILSFFFQVRIPCLYALSLHEHLQERTLDAIITRKDLPMPGEFSDHSLLISQCQLPRPPVCFADVSTRAGKASTKTASAESFWPAVCACHWRHMLAYQSTNCKNDTTPRYTPSPHERTRSVPNCTSPMSAD